MFGDPIEGLFGGGTLLPSKIDRYWVRVVDRALERVLEARRASKRKTDNEKRVTRNCVCEVIPTPT